MLLFFIATGNIILAALNTYLAVMAAGEGNFSRAAICAGIAVFGFGAGILSGQKAI